MYQANLVNTAHSELYRSSATTAGDPNSAYDAEGRLRGFARGTLNGARDQLTTQTHSQSFDLDPLGNFNAQTTDGKTTARAYNSQNQGTTVASTDVNAVADTFDADGNTITVGVGASGRDYGYDAWDRLILTATGTPTLLGTYSYDALGRRITEVNTTAGTTNHLYYSSAWQVLEQRSSANTNAAVMYQYVWGAAYVDELVLRDTYSGGVLQGAARLYALSNASFDITSVVNTSGVVQERYEYDPYGAVTYLDNSWVPHAPSTQSWQYLHQGGRLDAVSGWYGFRMRDLMPGEGRWAERDPLGLGAGDRNLYRYVGNSPAAMVDPLGLMGDELDDLLGHADRTGEVLNPFYRGTRSRVSLQSEGGIHVAAAATNAIPGGLATGGKAVVNGMGTAARRTISLGFWATPVEIIPVSQADRDNGYDTAVQFATASGEIFIAVGTAGLSKATSIPGGVRNGAKIFDAAGNVVGFVRSGKDAVDNGLNFSNGLGMAGAALGLAGNIKGLRVNCFPTDTPVVTESGLRPISEITSGERVWAFDFTTGSWQLSEVDQRHDATFEGRLVELGIDQIRVTATERHPFWVISGEGLEDRPFPGHVPAEEDRGLSLQGRWVNSHDLRAGDVVFLRNGGPARISSVELRAAVIPVCNLTVRGLHTYAVGEGQVLVHNVSNSGAVPNSNPHLAGKTPLAGTRTTGVRRAARAEVDRVIRTGKGTVEWSAEELAFIKANKRLPEGVVGHHINNVDQFPDWAGDPRNVKFVRGQPGNLDEHGGNFQNPTTGPLIDR